MPIQQLASWTVPLGLASLLFSAIGIWAVGYVIIRLPANHFTDDSCPQPISTNQTICGFWCVARNLIGALLIIAGIVMLVLPGQGLLSILLGISLCDLPGKRKLLCWILDRKAIRKSLNWFRRKSGRPPFEFPTSVCH